MAKIGMIVVADKREPLQMAAMVASVGAVSGHEVLVLIAMNALRYFASGHGARPRAEGEMGRLIEQKNVTPFQDLFAHAADLGGARIHPCSMALDVTGVQASDLPPYFREPMGLTQFLDEAAGGQLLSF